MSNGNNVADESKGKVVGVPLTADELKKFLAYKARSFLRNDSEAARKLILERLNELEKETATA